MVASLVSQVLQTYMPRVLPEGRRRRPRGLGSWGPDARYEEQAPAQRCLDYGQRLGVVRRAVPRDHDRPVEDASASAPRDGAVNATGVPLVGSVDR